MNTKAIETIKKFNMLRKGQGIIVGLSGGADSCALLLFLCSIREEYMLRLYACHVNHGLRGEEADKDEAFTKELCERLGVQWFGITVDVKKESEIMGVGTEECGRLIRYDFFERKADELDAIIATAHTASDNAETVLFNLSRGSGLTGLCGIPPVRGRIIRPLIEVTRQETEEYCRRCGITFRIDKSNLTREYTRNRIRLDVVPHLREINPSFESSVTAMSARLREADDYIRQSSERSLEDLRISGGYDASGMAGLHPAVFAAAVRKLCEEHTVIPTAKHIELIRKIVYNGGAVEISGGIYAVSSQGCFRIVYPKSADSGDECPVIPGGDFGINNKCFELSLLNIYEFNNRQQFDKNLFANSLDYDTIPLTSVFRTRKSGDVFTLPRRNVTKSVKKLMIELRIPREERGSIVLLADGGRVLWAEGVGASRDSAVNETTRRVLIIRQKDSE